MLYQLSYFRNFRFSAEHRFRPFGGGGGDGPADRVGGDGFEPPKSKDSRFTVCPIWPLWYPPDTRISRTCFRRLFPPPLAARKDVVATEPMEGFEPPTS